MPTTLAAAELQRLARLGAIARLKEIEAEATAIRRAFPGLRGGTTPATRERPPARRKRQMSPEAREAARKRMQDYWARRKSGTVAASPEAGADQASERPARARKPRKARKGRGKKVR